MLIYPDLHVTFEEVLRRVIIIIIIKEEKSIVITVLHFFGNKLMKKGDESFAKYKVAFKFVTYSFFVAYVTKTLFQSKKTFVSLQFFPIQQSNK